MGVPIRGGMLSKEYPEYNEAVKHLRSTMASLDMAGGFGDEKTNGGGGDVYDFNNIVHCCSKVFAEGGEAFEGYLNESKEFQAFKKEMSRQHERGEGGDSCLDGNYNDLRLPPVKGSRSLIIGSLCFRIGLNLLSYNRYLKAHSVQTKVDEDGASREANMLIRTLYHGLRNRHCVAYIYAAGLSTACIGDPLVFVLNKLAGRHTIHRVWDVAIEAVKTLVLPADTGITRDTVKTTATPGKRPSTWRPLAVGTGGRVLFPKPADPAAYQNNWQTLNPDAGTIFKTKLLAEFPDWTTAYELWEGPTRTDRVPHVQRYMSYCLDSSRSYLIAEYVSEQRWKWIEKVQKNRNKDCSGVPELEHAPVNTDTTESGIGRLDYHLYRTLANFHTTFGVVMCQGMQIFSTQAGQVDRVNRKRKACDHVKQTDRYSMTSYWSMSPEKRGFVLDAIARQFTENLARLPKVDEDRQRDAHFGSKLAARNKFLTRQMRKLINFRCFKGVKLYTHDTRKEFREAWAVAGPPTGRGITEKNRFAADQLRTRLYCYGVSAKSMPNYSNIAPGIGGAKVFLNTVIEYFARCREPLELVVPLVGSMRTPRKHLDFSATTVDKMFAKELEAMSTAFLSAHPEGVFVAYRFEQPCHVNDEGRRKPRTVVKPGDEFEKHGQSMCSFSLF